jgi:hypothetical protein
MADRRGVEELEGASAPGREGQEQQEAAPYARPRRVWRGVWLIIRLQCCEGFLHAPIPISKSG